MRAPKDAPRFQLNTKLLNFKLWCVIPTGMLTCTAVMSGDDNQRCNAEQCKSPERDLRPVLYIIKLGSSMQPICLWVRSFAWKRLALKTLHIHGDAHAATASCGPNGYFAVLRQDSVLSQPLP